MKSKIKVLLTFPPFCFINTPYPSVPVLLGQLKAAGIDAKGVDFNLEFFKEKLNPEGIKDAMDKAEKFVESLPDKYKKMSSRSSEYRELSKDEKILVLKKEKYNYFKQRQRAKIANSYKYVNTAMNALRTEEFYNPESLYKSYKIIYDAISILFLPYAPTKIEKLYYNYENELYKNNYEDIKEQTYKTEINPFIEFFTKKIEDGYFDEYDLVGISIPSLSQIVPGFTLARLLKEKGKKVCLGGNLLTRFEDTLSKNKDIFEKFCDYILLGEGEESIVSLTKAVDGAQNFDDVSGLMFIQNNKIKTNPVSKISLDEVAPISFEGYDLSGYLTPEIVLSLQISKGCYWNKCVFCDLHYGKPYYYILSAQKAVDVIEDIYNRYNIRFFEFEDEALPPAFCKEFAEEIMKRKLNVRYSSYLRLEKEFDKSLLSLMFKSGYTRALWGYEASSERVMTLMNKGINTKTRHEILKNADSQGIWNHVSFIYAFPTETIEEIKQTIEYLINNLDIIHSYQMMPFVYTKFCKILGSNEEYGITKCIDKGDFQPNYDCRIKNMSKKTKDKIEKNLNKMMIELTGKSLVNMLYLHDYLMLYLEKYSFNYVQSYKYGTNLKRERKRELSCFTK